MSTDRQTIKFAGKETYNQLQPGVAFTATGAIRSSADRRPDTMEQQARR